MLQVRLESGLVEWEREVLVVALRDGRVPDLTPVSFDGGETWTTAAAAVMRIDQVPDEWSRFVPKGVAPLAHVTSTVAPIVAVFFSTPVLFTVWKEAHRDWKPVGTRLTWLLFGFLACALPLISLGVISLRNMKKHPHLKGVGRSWFAICVGLALTIPLLISLAGVLL
ncbi:MAG: hypothetical protein ACO1OB_27265 [Archangium sp.]